MRPFFIKTAVAVIVMMILGWLMIGTVLPRILSENSYLAASIDKQKRLRELPGKRIIFIGGSNAAFGIDSKLIGEKTGISPVNMGLHAGLGIEYMLNETAGGMREGDMVVLTPEYYLGDGQLRLLALLGANNPSALQYMNLSVFDRIRLRTNQFQICLRFLFYRGESLNQLYIRNGFNAEGDLCSHVGLRDDELVSPPQKVVFGTYDYQKELALINGFISKCRQKKVSVCFIFPGFTETAYADNKASISDFRKTLEYGMKCTILGTPEDFLYPDSQIVDATYHLRKKARTERAVRMSELLQDWIASGAK